MSISSLIHGRKRFVVAGVLAASLAGGAFAFANSLNPVSNTLGSGSTGVSSPEAACVPTFSYATTWDGTNGQFDVTTVTATAATATADCNSDSVQAEITGTGGNLPYNLANTAYAGGDGTHQATASWTLSGTGSQIAPASGVTGITGAVTGTK